MMSVSSTSAREIYTPKSKNLKIFYCLGAKAWNNISTDLRNKSDSQSVSKLYKTQLLESITKMIIMLSIMHMITLLIDLNSFSKLCNR